MFSLVAKAVNDRARVIAFEPVSDLAQKLKENCRINEFDVECQQLAVSDADGTAEIFIAPGGIQTLSLQKNPLRTEKEDVVVRRLTTFIGERGIDRVDLMKIDVESYEPQVLAGLGPYLQAMRPTIILEILNDEIGARVQPIIEGCEYFVFRLDEHLGAVMNCLSKQLGATHETFCYVVLSRLVSWGWFSSRLSGTRFFSEHNGEAHLRGWCLKGGVSAGNQTVFI